MNIEKLFSTKERIEILSRVIYSADHLSVNRTAKDVKLSKSLVSKYFYSLTKEGVLKRSNGKFLVQNNIKTRAIRILLNLNIFDTDFFKKYKFVKSVGIYGSFVKGTNTEDSDIDLWIFIDRTKEESLAKLTSELKKTFGNVKPLYLTKEKIELLKKEDMTFYYSILFGSITLYGDGIEAV